MSAWNVAAEGLVLGLSLIVALGAQNSFVLREGLRGNHPLLMALFCTASDLALTAAGLWGLGTLLRGQPWFLAAVTWGGAGFLAVYGLRSLVRALRSTGLELSGEGEGRSPLRLVTVLAGFTFLNPHVYLDTVLLLGALGNRHGPDLRPAFLAGVGTASLVWFLGLAYGARLLVPLFRRPLTWRLLDALIGLTMLGLAVSLLVSPGLGLA